MAELKARYEGLGLEGVQTYIQSGNVVFRAQAGDPVSFQELITQEIKAWFGFEVRVFVTTGAYFLESIQINPFTSNMVNEDLKKFHLTFLSQSPDISLLHDFKSKDYSPDKYEIIDNRFYLYCPQGYNNTQLSNDYIEKKLRVRATTRNWNTVMKLGEMINQ